LEAAAEEQDEEREGPFVEKGEICRERQGGVKLEARVGKGRLKEAEREGGMAHGTRHAA